MQIKNNGWLVGWRAVFAAIAVNILLSIGVEFIGIDNIQITTCISTAAYTVFAFCFALFYSRGNISAGFSDIGFRRFNPMLLPLLIILPTASQLFCSFMVTPITLILQMLFGFELKEEILAPHGVRETVIAFVYVCILAPVSEEIIFRGVIYRYFEKYSTLAAIFLSSLTFAAAHLDIRSFIPIFFVGLVLALFRFTTGSVFATMIAHASVNLFGLMMMFLMDNTALYTVITLVFAVSFPFSVSWFLKHTSFPHIRKGEGRCGISVFMILTIVVFMVFQMFMLVSNVADMVHGKEFFYEFGNEMPGEFKYNFEYDFDDFN